MYAHQFCMLSVDKGEKNVIPTVPLPRDKSVIIQKSICVLIYNVTEIESIHASYIGETHKLISTFLGPKIKCLLGEESGWVQL